MTWTYWLAAAAAITLFAYLVVAMIKPEWFE